MAKKYSRRMSVRFDGQDSSKDLSKMNPNELKKQIESTDSIVETLDRDMMNMDRALGQLRKRKKEDEEERKKEVGLKEREIEVLVASQVKLGRSLDMLKADYISEDVEDVIASLKIRVQILQEELAASRRRNELIERFADEGDGDGNEGGKLEVLEGMIAETKPLALLLDQLSEKQTSMDASIAKMDAELKSLKAKNGTESQVKALCSLVDKMTPRLFLKAC